VVVGVALVQAVAAAVAGQVVSSQDRRAVAAAASGPVVLRSDVPSLHPASPAAAAGPADRPSTPAAAPAPPTGVGVITLDLYDPGRPTVAGGRVLAPSRHLPTEVRYPAVGPRGGDEGAGAPLAAGPWPLVVFAHGYDVTPDTYRHLLHAWAQAGFIVAAPAFPLEAAGGPLDENDLANEPADIGAVITALVARSAAGSGPLAHAIDPNRIAVAGHSDGAVAALAAAFGRSDGRIGPVIAMAGAASAGVPHPDPRHPLLVVQGLADTTDPPVNSWQVYQAARPPRILLELYGAGHLPPIADDTPWRPIVESVTIDFLRHYFGLGATIGALAAAGTHPGVSFIGGEA